MNTNLDPHKTREDVHVKRKAEIGVTMPQAKEYQALREKQERESTAHHTLTQDC